MTTALRTCQLPGPESPGKRDEEYGEEQAPYVAATPFEHTRSLRCEYVLIEVEA